MPIQVLPSFLLFNFIQGITPGPANLASLYASIRFGKTKALKQWLGIWTGFLIVSILSGILAYFVGEIFSKYVKYFAFIGAIYLIYLAIHILFQKQSENQNSKDKIGFLSGVLIQLTNVKVMICCFTSLSSYVLPYNQDFLSLFLISICLPFTGPICNLVWLFTGVSLNKLFKNHYKIVNIVMAISLLVCSFSLVFMAIK